MGRAISFFGTPSRGSLGPRLVKSRKGAWPGLICRCLKRPQSHAAARFHFQGKIIDQRPGKAVVAENNVLYGNLPFKLPALPRQQGQPG